MKKLKIKKEFLVYHLTGGVCLYCTEPAAVVDHFYPKIEWKKGGLFFDCKYAHGPNDLSNLVPACNHCNSQKSDTWPFDFIQKIIGDHDINGGETHEFFFNHLKTLWLKREVRWGV